MFTSKTKVEALHHKNVFFFLQKLSLKTKEHSFKVFYKNAAY